MNCSKFILIVLASTIGASVCGGCSHARDGTAVDARAARIWHEQEVVFKKAALEGSLKNDEFDRACLFFEQITGLEMHANLSTLGALPTAETVHDLERIQAWYKINAYRLYWDEAARKVRVRGTR
jgi:hypothetical protein